MDNSVILIYTFLFTNVFAGCFFFFFFTAYFTPLPMPPHLLGWFALISSSYNLRNLPPMVWSLRGGRYFVKSWIITTTTTTTNDFASECVCVREKCSGLFFAVVCSVVALHCEYLCGVWPLNIYKLEIFQFNQYLRIPFKQRKQRHLAAVPTDCHQITWNACARARVCVWERESIVNQNECEEFHFWIFFSKA